MKFREPEPPDLSRWEGARAAYLAPVLPPDDPRSATEVAREWARMDFLAALRAASSVIGNSFGAMNHAVRKAADGMHHLAPAIDRSTPRRRINQARARRAR